MNGEVEAGECTYTRYYPLNQDKALPIIADMEHNISCTSIIVNKEFWNSLTTEQQEAMQAAAIHSAKIERVESVNDAVRVEAECKSKWRQGYQVVRRRSCQVQREDSSSV